MLPVHRNSNPASNVGHLVRFNYMFEQELFILLHLSKVHLKILVKVLEDEPDEMQGILSLSASVYFELTPITVLGTVIFDHTLDSKLPPINCIVVLEVFVSLIKPLCAFH
jgi:hypothetical protein